MNKHVIFRVLLFFTLFFLGYSQLYAFDDKRDQEVKAVELKLYLEEQGVENNEEKAWNLLQQAAQDGDAAAMHKIATMYELGTYVDKDYRWAMLWHLRAAVRGYADAQCAVGILYEDGLGGYRDVTAALFWYEKAAAQGDPFSIEAIQRLKKPTHETDSMAPKTEESFIDKEKYLKAEADTVYLYIREAMRQSNFILNETQKLLLLDQMINMSNSQKNMQRVEMYKKRKKELMVNMENALSMYSVGFASYLFPCDFPIPQYPTLKNIGLS